VIVDDVILYSDTTETLFEYFEAVLEVQEFHCVTIKLKKTKGLEPELLFVGRDISAAGNSPALAKFAAFKSLPRARLGRNCSMERVAVSLVDSSTGT
jgi:hypothetical protein